MNQQTFHYEFADTAQRSTVSFDYANGENERFAVRVEDGLPVIYGNRSGFMLMAKLFAQLALSKYKNGFHFEVSENFDADGRQALRIVVNDSEQATETLPKT